MEIIFLDADTVGNVSNLYRFNELGKFTTYEETTPEQVADRIAHCEVIITNKVPMGREAMEKAPKLALICVAATGTDHIDKTYAQERGIQVMNVENYSTYSVAQHTFAMMLGLLHHLQYYDQYVKTGMYSQQSMFTNLDRPIYELSGKVFGIIGLGNIGRKVAEIAEAFGARVVYYSSSGVDPARSLPTPGVCRADV